MNEAEKSAVDENSRARSCAHAGLTRAEWLLLLVLAAVQFTHILDFMIVMPLGPHYKDDLQISAPQQFGFMVSAYAFSASLAGLAGGLVHRPLRPQDGPAVALRRLHGWARCCARPPRTMRFLLAGAGRGGRVRRRRGGQRAGHRRRRLPRRAPRSGDGRHHVGVLGGVDRRRARRPVPGQRARLAVAVRRALAGLERRRCCAGALRAAAACAATSVSAPAAGLASWDVLRRADAPARLRPDDGPGAEHLHDRAVPGVVSGRQRRAGRKPSLPYVYLCGGLATLLTMTLFGWLSDRLGKLPVFRVLALSPWCRSCC